MKNLLVAMVLCLGMAGCTRPAPPSVPHEQPASTETLRALGELEASGAWDRAFMGYRTAMARPADGTVAEMARLGAARCLLAMNRNAAALVVLDPLPADPSNDWERRRLALAAQAMLHLSSWSDAESLAEVALAGLDRSEARQRWAAVCSANLAKAYLENGKLFQSALLYRSASRLFRANNSLQAATECMALALDIEKALDDGDRVPATGDDRSPSTE